MLLVSTIVSMVFVPTRVISITEKHKIWTHLGWVKTRVLALVSGVLLEELCVLNLWIIFIEAIIISYS